MFYHSARRIAHCLETGAAVYRPVVTGNEGNLRDAAAGGTGRFMHLTGAAGASVTLSGVTAGFATNGFVLKAALSVEVLFTGGKRELSAAVPADQGFVFVHGLDLLLKSMVAHILADLVFVPTSAVRKVRY
jgi:hypothetical protein